MKTFSLIIVAAFLITPVVNPGKKFSEAEDFILKLKKESETVGLSVSVSYKGKLVYSKAFGYESLEHETNADPAKTRYRVASISKAMTSAALGVLIENNKIDIDLPVQHYAPYFPEKKHTITTRQVAGHIAGIRHYKEGEFFSAIRYKSVKEGLEIFMNDSLLFEPGTKYLYSSYGYNLLSAIIEGASGQDFLPFIKKNVFDPLNMDATVPDYHDSIVSHRSDFYSMKDGKIVHAPYVDNSYKWAGGGFLSTTEDLVKFGNGMLYNELFSESTRNQLTTSQTTNDGKATGYGMGWADKRTVLGRKYFGHRGGAVGGCGNLIIYPDEELVLAFYTNDSKAKVGDEIHILAELFLNVLRK